MPQRSDVAIRMDEELENWAAEYCGLLGTEVRRGGGRGDPDKLRAARVERQLLDLKNGKGRLRKYWEVLMTRYRNRWMAETSSAHLRMAPRTYRDNMLSAYRWLDGRLNDGQTRQHCILIADRVA